jgi:hypothetical protein
MGKWGFFLSRVKWDFKGYTDQTEDFFKGIEEGDVKFGYSGQHTDSIKDDIPVEHVRWALRYVGRITDRQIRAALTASGASAVEVGCFARAFRERINQLRRVAR